MAPSRAYEWKPLPPQQKSDGCGIGCFRLFFYTLSTISIALSLGLIGASIYSIVLREELPALLHSSSYSYLLFGLLGIGGFSLLTSFICCSAARQKCVTTFFIFLLFISFLAEATLSYLVLVEGMTAERNIRRNFQSDVFNEYGIDMEITKSIDSVQIEGHCCGAYGFDDFLKNSQSEEEEEEYVEGQRKPRRQYVPDTCCKTVKRSCGLNDHPSNIYYTGCENYLQESVKQHFHCLFFTCFFAAFVHFLQLLFTWCLCCRLGKCEKSPLPDHLPINKANSIHEMSLFD
ncbi:unnamed protein product, partial [Mesorhabditis belari]|uniref:Tetraspanin n=1 Tax=Mesorhabditis belari TaxID=2138241 RepID=A0AAF3JB23_9BILA